MALFPVLVAQVFACSEAQVRATQRLCNLGRSLFCYQHSLQHRGATGHEPATAQALTAWGAAAGDAAWFLRSRASCGCSDFESEQAVTMGTEGSREGAARLSAGKARGSLFGSWSFVE
jgi:hypothetical protein